MQRGFEGQREELQETDTPGTQRAGARLLGLRLLPGPSSETAIRCSKPVFPLVQCPRMPPALRADGEQWSDQPAATKRKRAATTPACSLLSSFKIMPFHGHQKQVPSASDGILSAAINAASIGVNLRSSSGTTTSGGTDSLLEQSNKSVDRDRPNESSTKSYNNTDQHVHAMAHNRLAYDPAASPAHDAGDYHSYTSPRNNSAQTHFQRVSDDLRLPSNAPSLSSPYSTPHRAQQAPYQPDSAAPSFAVQQATPQGSGIVPSNAASTSTLPGALQPAGGLARPAPSASYTAPATVPTMQQQPPLQNNASQYTQSPSRANTLHSHSRSSPGGMDSGHKYIPFNQTPAQTPVTSNPKAFNISNAHTPSAGPSHSPLNLTDIRSRAISDANEGAQGTAFFSYSDSPTNSNYLAPFPTYAYDWCKWPVMGGSGAGKMAVGSYLEDPHNFIQILDTQITPQEGAGPGQSPYGLEYSKVAEATCAYPVTRILWEPPSSQKNSTDLLATSGDHLRLWSLPAPGTPHSGNNINRTAAANSREPPPQKLQPLALLSNSKTPEHTAPLTSLDWNTLSPKLIITSSIDTTCTIWDIPTLTAKTQLIAHDKEVFDVRFCAGSVDVFVSCGADGSVRMFDLRSLEHSTIIYEPAEKSDKGMFEVGKNDF